MKSKNNKTIWLLPLIIVCGLVFGYGSGELVKTVINNKNSSTIDNGLADGGFGESIDKTQPSTEMETPSFSEEDGIRYGVSEVTRPNDDTISIEMEDNNPSNVTNEVLYGFAIQEIEGPFIEEASKTYKLTIRLTKEFNDRIKGLKSPFLFELYAPNSTTPTYSSALGSFSGVLPSATSERQPGTYTLKITDTESGDVIEKEVKGFMPIYNKVTCAQLTKNFNSGGPSSFIHEAKGVHIKLLNCTELPPTTLYDVYTRLAANWTRVDVTSVEFNERNQITDITIRVTP